MSASAISSGFENSVHQIKAAAGSGKTHTLISLLFALLTENNKNVKEVFSSILAITFTNAAAAEMKAKLIHRLKSVALGLEPGNTQKQEALQVLDKLIEHYSSLNIRTIDSFLLMLLKQNILDSHLPPDFEILFSEENFITPLLDELAFTALNRDVDVDSEEVQMLLPYYKEMYASIYHLTQIKGFLGLERIREYFIDIYTPLKNLHPEQRRKLSTKEELQAAFSETEKYYNAALLELDTFIKSKKLQVKKDYTRTVEDFFERQEITSFFRGSFEKIKDKVLYKKSITLLEEFENSADNEKFSLFLKKIISLHKRIWLLKNALKYVPLIKLCQLILEMQDYEEFAHEKLYSGRVSELLNEYIYEDNLLPTMLSRMPYQLDFLLIDEFQDTNKEQWGIIHAFVEDLLSREGSFTYVGDVKQAIYSWRGGDSSLFERILEDIPAPVTRTVLETNWRSADNIIAFNNMVFSQLKEERYAKILEERLLPKEYINQTSFVHELCENYKNVEQKTSPKYQGKNQGKALIYKIKAKGIATEDLHEVLAPQFLKAVKKASEMHEYKDMAVLVRSNKDCIHFAKWLTQAGIPVITEGALQLSANFIIQQCLSFLEFLKDTDNELALWHIVAFEGLFSAEKYDILDYEDWLAAKAAGQSLLDCLKEKSEALYLFLEEYKTNRNSKSVYVLLCELMEKTELFSRFKSQSGFFVRFLELVFQARTRNIDTLPSFLSYWYEEGHEEKIPMPEGVNAVRILTIHKSKGAEFNVVFLWDNFRKDTSKDELKHYTIEEDEKVEQEKKLSFFAQHSIYHPEHAEDLKIDALETLNLLYVAFTRAKKELHILYREAKTLNPIQILLESVEAKCISLADEENILVFGNIEEKEEYEKRTEATEIITELPTLHYRMPALNFGELKDYRTDALNANRRGTIIHNCLERYFKVVKYNKNCEAKVIYSVLHESFLSFKEQELLFQTIREIFAWLKTLPDFVLWEKYGLSELSMVDKNKQLLRCDLFVSTPDIIHVIDFKTGKEYAEHSVQIQKYMSLISLVEANRNKKISASLVYLDLMKVSDIKVEEVLCSI